MHTRPASPTWIGIFTGSEKSGDSDRYSDSRPKVDPREIIHRHQPLPAVGDWPKEVAGQPWLDSYHRGLSVVALLADS
jgi:hypothetical protein